ncbi:PAS domain-containing protein [Hymenobacter sp. ASUV-10]|uniref:histidine kinase n=1 Tax=Hymenobacter aranciens TaxID=3063996 RepID=A0ABT9BGT1_9BACT|nr:PAS domain-containing protein [Hymenobacter sp. ASUV-10]MDO7877462.1 PAS domain-containing protein [Hymenobacter sp. ASUV-10]
MDTHLPSDPISWAAQLAAERERRQQAEAALAAAEARIAALEQQRDNVANALMLNQQEAQKLFERCHFYETVLEQIPVAVAVVDTEFRYLYLNPAVEPDLEKRVWMLGKTNEEVCLFHQRPPAVTAQRQRGFEQARDEKREVSWEDALLDGRAPRYVLRHLKPIYEEDGELRFMIGTGIDITDRKLVEAKVAQQQEFYESILNFLPVDVAVFDSQHRYVFVNPSAIADPVMRRNIIGMTDAEYLAFRQRPAALAEQREHRFGQAIRMRQDVTWEETMMSATGPKHILRTMRAVFGADDQLQLMVGSGIDITARYEAEQQHQLSEVLLREQQDFVRLIVDALPNVVYVINAQNKVSFHNAAFDKITALSTHIHPEKRDRVVQEQVAQIRAWRQQVEQTGKSVSGELPVTLANGEVCQMQMHMRPLRRTDGSTDVLAVSTDITDLKNAKQEAEANAQAKEAFLSRMSHEIRTPLNGVLGMMALLKRTTLTPQQQEYLVTMQQAGQHLLALVNDVLDLAKITTHHLQLDLAAFDLSVLLHGAKQTVAPLASQKGLRFVIEPLILESARVVGDAYRLHQVLLNLLSNAIKFTMRGQVRLGITPLRETPQALTLRFWVEDSGVGIAPEEHTHIFDAFAQANAETSRRSGGTGLGLAISEQLVHHMGGTLLLCSTLGEGTTFSFVLTLPRAPEELAEQPVVTFENNFEGLRGLRVLLAEDNLVNQWIAIVLLEHWGVEVYAVANGTEALHQLQENEYDAALLDIHMPGLNGVEVTMAIRQNPDPGRAVIPIIALTANAFAADQEKYLAAGMNGCVTKPFQEADLCRMLLELTRGSKEPQ